ncbi:DUF4157 domain-containing protein [Streptomyces sp. NBC_01003]|nr:DUF4157 domain-containing protein [Streptomyces sp. NBC_01003]
MAALQRSVGNDAVVRMLGRGEAPVQRSAVPDALRSAGRPLAEPVRTEMEARLGADFADVRLHTGSVAQRSAAELGARAYTSGNDIVIGRGGGGRHILAHELTHVIQQRRGPVAGTDIGSGLRVSDPSDRFEQAAERNACTALAGPVPERDRAEDGHRDHAQTGEAPAHVQRFAVVRPGSAQYPVLGTLDAQGRPGAATADFFPGQVARPRTFTEPSGETEQRPSYVDADGNLNVEYRGQAPLRLADHLDLAVEDTGGGRQAKTFFATQKRIDQANDRLRGRVSLERGESLMTLTRTTKLLKIITRDKELTLWQVVPVMNRPAGVQRPATQQRGLAIRLPQRCNEIATAVSGKHSPEIIGEQRYFHALADVLGSLAQDTTAAQERAKLQTAWDTAASDTSATARKDLSDVLAALIGKVVAYRDDPARALLLTEAYERFRLNRFTPPAGIGDVFMIKALRPDATSGGLDFHFGGVVAKSGEDHVTMENFARHEEDQTLSGGDPQWYFEMYGPQRSMQSFHEQWGWEGRFDAASGAQNRLVLTILLQ